MAHPIIVTEPGLVSEAILCAWIVSGRPISEVWTRASDREMRRFRHVMEAGVNVRQIRPLRKEVPDLPAGADALFTIMTLQIVPDPLLAHFGGRALNIHPALLPELRGLAPRQSMLVDGTTDRLAGLTIHVLERTIDTGAVVARQPMPPRASETWHDWEARTALTAAEMFVREVPEFLAGKIGATPQPTEGAFYRKSIREEFVVTSDKSSDEVRHLLTSLRGMLVVCRPDGGFKGRAPQTFVTRFGKSLGPPTGEPARWFWTHVELDQSDARVRLLRPGPMDKWREYRTAARVRAGAAEIGRTFRI